MLVSEDSMNRPFIIPIFLPHVGCPHQCAFCNQTSITGAKNDIFTPEKLRFQINKFLRYKKRQGPSIQVAFYGGNFLGLNKDYIKLLLDESTMLVKNGIIDSIRFSTRPDTIDQERLDILDNYPVSTVEIGVQSMDDGVLLLAKRGHTSLDTENAVAQLKERNYEIGLQMMVGLPGDDETKSLNTAHRMADLSPDFVRVYPTVVLANSRLAIWYQKGKYKPWSLERCVTFVTKLYLLFKNKKIPVIRMGLQASENFEKGSVIVAGPYHPAFGHLVYSEIFLDMATAIMKTAKVSNKTISIMVHPRSISKMRGLKNMNIEALTRKFHIKSLEIIPDPSLAEDKLAIAL